ncbi:uncharacterized protein LOC144142050 [Haemaphysalis longicornis]
MATRVFRIVCLYFAVSVPLAGAAAGLDAFWLIAMFPDLTVISDSNNDGIFECARAIRTDVNFGARTATFILDLKDQDGPEKKNTTFYLTGGSTPNSFVYTTDEEPNIHENVLVEYSNLKDCAILTGVYHEPRCLLFVPTEAANELPSECFENFEDLCGPAAPSDRSKVC